MYEPLFIVDTLLALAVLIAVSVAGRRAGRLHRDAASARPLRRALIVTGVLLGLRLAAAVLVGVGSPALLGLGLTLGLPVALATTGWGDTALSLPTGAWRDVLTGTRVVSDAAGVSVGELLARLPVALLVRD